MGRASLADCAFKSVALQWAMDNEKEAPNLLRWGGVSADGDGGYTIQIGGGPHM